MSSIDEQRRWRQRLKLGVLTAVAGPTAGLAATCWGLSRAFQTIRTAGVGDPSKVSVAVGGELIATALGLLIGFSGLFVAVIAWTKIKGLRHDRTPSIS